MKLSIIIPVYNVQQYIERCVRSLMEQTLKDEVEFIFVNDCTPDASMEVLYSVLDEYPNRKKQVRIVENEYNLGVTATRKRGVSEACGEYIGWCDADDWCEKHMFESMLNMSDNGTKDIVVCNYYDEKQGGSIIQSFKKCSNPKDCIQRMWEGYCFPASFWQQITKKDIVCNAIESIVDTNYGEDIYTNLYIYYNANSIAYIAEPLYHHFCDNMTSLVHNVGFTYSDWKLQKQNIENISRLLYNNGGWEAYHIAINYLKFYKKLYFRSAFHNIWSYYKEFSECYKDVNIFLYTPKNKRFKTYLYYNFYPFFCFFYKK